MAEVAIRREDASYESNPSASHCNWYDYFPGDEINYLVKIIAALDIVSAVAIALLYSQKRKIARKFKNRQSVEHLYIFFLSSFMKVIVHLLASSHLIDFMLEKYYSPCHLFGFLESFFSVLEVEALTLACVERYVVAKYITYGWPNRKEFYGLYFNLCLMFAILYSNPFWFSMARFGHDFTCNTCTLSMVLPESLERNFIVSVFLLSTVKPWVFMLLMLFWARQYENNFTHEMLKKADLNFTLVVAILVFVNLASWIPLALIRGWTLFSQLLYGEMAVIPFFYIEWAMSIYELAPAVTTLVMLISNKFFSDIKEQKKD